MQNGDDCLTVGNGAKNIHWRYVLRHPTSPVDLKASCNTEIPTAKGDMAFPSVHLAKVVKWQMLRTYCESLKIDGRDLFTCYTCRMESTVMVMVMSSRKELVADKL